MEQVAKFCNLFALNSLDPCENRSVKNAYGVFLFRQFYRENIVLAAAVLAALPTFLLFFVMQKYLVEGIKMTGIK
jgi:ABC-type maltose transport system permease subunit